MNSIRVTRAVGGLLIALICAAAVPSFAAEKAGSVDPQLARGSRWIALRAGYAKRSGEFAANGLAGVGFGYRRFVLDRWAVGAFMNYDVLGKFGEASDIEIPLTLEITRHSRWGTAFYPYVGVGAGAFYRKYYKTGADFSSWTGGRYLTMGGSTEVRKGGFLGVDVRLAIVDLPDDNPVFAGPDPARQHVDDVVNDLVDGKPVVFIQDRESKSETHWSFKVDYSIHF